MRLAAIDIGTNSVHMIVVQVRPDFSFEIIDREKEMVRLGAGGLDGKALTESAMAAALQALSKFKRLAESHEVDEIIASATSATREAENGGDFLRAVAAQTGIAARVITGREEARLIHLAAAYGTDLAGGTGVVVDIGGGSVEITLGSSTDVQLARSFKLGVIRTDRAVREVRPDLVTGRAAPGRERARADCGARRADQEARISARHRHLGHHPEPGNAGRRRRRYERSRRPAQRPGRARKPFTASANA